MAGPGIRAWHLAEELKKHFETTLIAKGSPRDRMHDASVLIGQPARGFGRRRREQRVIYDLFDPVVHELRELYGPHPSPRQRLHVFAEQWRLRRALAAGDRFLCATPQQRELYAAVADRILEVPFGVEQGIRTSKDRNDVIVWGGGIWEWLDPQTAVQAIVQLNRQGVACRLLFLGRERPNEVGERGGRMDELIRAGEGNVAVKGDWVPYGERFASMANAKIAIMLHRATTEARYSIRTRLFDAIAAAIPVVATEEGFAADLVAREGLGVVVPAGDPNAVAAAIRRLLRDDAFYAACVSSLERLRPRFAWDIVTRPLIETVERWKQG